MNALFFHIGFKYCCGYAYQCSLCCHLKYQFDLYARNNHFYNEQAGYDLYHN